MNPIFASIVSISKTDPTVKYRRCYEGASPADVASIAQAKAFQDILVQEFAKRNLPIGAPKIVAMEALPALDQNGNPSVSAGGVFRTYPVEEMLADGYPEGLATKLFFLWERNQQEEDEDGFSRGAHRYEVADVIREWFANPQRFLDELAQRR